MLKQVFDLPETEDPWYAELAVVLDLRSKAPLASLQYLDIVPALPEPMALIQLPSNGYIEIMDYRTTLQEGLFHLTRFGRSRDPRLVLDEFLLAAELTVDNLLWSELDGIRKRPRR